VSNPKPSPKRAAAERALKTKPCTRADLRALTKASRQYLDRCISEWLEAGQIQAVGHQYIDRPTGGPARLLWQWVAR
jgi:hypothetical protein